MIYLIGSSPIDDPIILIMKNVNTVPSEIGITDLILGRITETKIPIARKISCRKNKVMDTIKNILLLKLSIATNDIIIYVEIIYNTLVIISSVNAASNFDVTIVLRFTGLLSRKSAVFSLDSFDRIDVPIFID